MPQTNIKTLSMLFGPRSPHSTLTQPTLTLASNFVDISDVKNRSSGQSGTIQGS